MPTTPNGTVYTIEAFTSSAGESAWRAAANPAARMPVVLFCHGNPGAVDTSADQQFGAGYTTLRNWLIDNGWGYIEGHGAGANWGNTAGRTAYEAMFSDTDSVWDIARVVVIGRSMGALVGAWLASQSTVIAPHCVGFVSLSGTADLSNRWSNAGTADRTNLETAYGVSGETAFRAAVATFDPLLAALSTWDSRNAIMQWDTSDTTVPYTVNGQAWDAKYGPRLTLRRTQSTTGGDHNSTPNDATHSTATIAFLQTVNDGVWSDTWSDVWSASTVEVTGTLQLIVGMTGTRTIDTSRTGDLGASVALTGAAVANVTRTADLAITADLTSTHSIDTVRTGDAVIGVTLIGDLSTGTITRTGNLNLAIDIAGERTVGVNRFGSLDVTVMLAGVVESGLPVVWPETLTLETDIPTLELSATVPTLTLEATW